MAETDNPPVNAAAAPLGLGLRVHHLDFDVVSCAQASEAKGIPLRHELKTLIMETSTGLFAVHVRGDKRASLRAIKRFLAVEQAYFARPASMTALGLSSGTVCPLVEPVWSLPQLLSEEVLTVDTVSANNGTTRGYFLFSPRLLLSMPHISVGKFELA